MSKHSVKVRRSIRGFLRTNRVGTDALGAIGSIPGVTDARLEDESDDSAIISYSWSGEEKFLDLAEHLDKFGLEAAE